MRDRHDSITALAHVHAAVALHRFVDPADWALGLAELAEMSDEEIELVTSDDPDHSSPSRRMPPIVSTWTAGPGSWCHREGGMSWRNRLSPGDRVAGSD